MFTRNFKNLSKSDVALAGGKGASLGEMTQAGIPVPPGFVVLSSSFERFVDETGIRADIEAVLDGVKHEDTNSVEQASKKIQGIILSEEMPKDIATEVQKEFRKLKSKYVAVRSSATSEDGASAAWAGQLDTFLNTTEKNVITNVKRCWASLFTPRAIFYRFEKGLQKDFISVAVVIQKMVQSEVSGIGFSVHPVTQDYNQLIIEAGYGLGEAIVSGSITPDSYVVLKKETNILEKNVAEQTRKLVKGSKENEWVAVAKKDQGKQKLTETQVIKLAKLIQQIEVHYGFPVDTEWAMEKGRLYITQSRPITTLTQPEEASAVSEKISLTKIYSREKTLFYFCMWNDSDRRGYSRFLGHRVKDSLFVIPPAGQKGSVWYAPSELGTIDGLLRERLKSPALIKNLTTTLDKNWKVLFPYLSGKKQITGIEEFLSYYEHLVDWWSAMNTAFGIPDMEEISKSTKKMFLAYRTESEKYTEQMNKVFIGFWKAGYPQYQDILAVITPAEAAKLARGTVSKRQVQNMRLRLQGFGMYNEKIYLQKDLQKQLQKSHVELERAVADSTGVVRGTTAFPGKVSGTVRIVHTFKDMGKVRKGDVLVTEMTNPDYVPIMKLAAAIVTNEGGATCHAAIASRELMVPCIVGTKIATEVFKDGDLVEVDATEGTIAKIVGDSQRPLYVKSYARDFCLPLIQMWCRAETTNPRQWTDKVNPKLPFEIFVRENGLVTDYMDDSGVDWIKGELKQLIKKDKNFVKKVVAEFYKRTKHIKPIWEKQQTLKHKELVDYFRQQEDVWAWFEAVWWIMEMVPEKSEAFRLTKAARVSTERMVPNGDILIRESLRKLFPKLGKLSEALTIEEVASKKVPSTKELKQRMAKYSFTNGQLFVGEGVAEMEKRFGVKIQVAVSEGKSVTEFSGQVAYPGKMRGIVRVLMSRADVGDLKTGEILVSPMTMPDYLPAMKRSAAFITDEGGVTSHAAIIARELKKPCIIGTKVATEVLKDGDLVEVDANGGIVRILKRQS